MGLVDDEQVKFARVGRLATWRQHFAEEAQRTLALEEVNRGDQAGKVRPGVDVQPPLATQIFQKRAIDDAKFQAEFVAHLVAPLHLQRGGTDNQYLARAMTYDKLLADKPRLNGLAQSDVISDQQVGARHLDGPHDRVKLVIFHLDTAAEGSLQGLDVSTGNGSPAYRVEKGIQPLGSIKADGNGECIPFGDFDTRLHLPDYLQFLAEVVILYRCERDQVLALVMVVRLRHSKQATGFKQIGW